CLQYCSIYCSSSRHNVQLNIGKGLRIMRFPSVPLGTSFPSSSTTAISTPRNCKPAEPGFIGVSQAAPASGVPAVSVCPHVLFTQIRPCPNTSRVQCHVSPSNGSPTSEMTSKQSRLY